jgi:cystathionine gamma-synthase
MGGSMVINPNTPRGRWMIQDMEVNHDEDGMLFTSDARALYQNSQDFVQRSNQVNRTAELLADWLYEHPDVQQVYYPKFTQPHFYQRFLNVRTTTTASTASAATTPGFGGLLSIVLEPHMCQRTFYDNLHVYKGPSLGTNFTLVCPYTLLAHYHELEFARAYQVSPNLLRVAVGLEDFSTLQRRFDQAFAIARLHPKLKPIQQTQRGYCTFSSSPYQRHTSVPQKQRIGRLSVQHFGVRPQPSFLTFSPYSPPGNLRPVAASSIVKMLRMRRVI